VANHGSLVILDELPRIIENADDRDREAGTRTSVFDAAQGSLLLALYGCGEGSVPQTVSKK
jgi:hypothetical protein